MRLLMLFAAMTLTACASQPETIQTRHESLPATSDALVVMEETDGCRVLEHIVGDAPFGTRKNVSVEAAVSDAHRSAIDAGADAIYFETTYSKLWGSTVLAKALKCAPDATDPAAMSVSRLSN